MVQTPEGFIHINKHAQSLIHLHENQGRVHGWAGVGITRDCPPRGSIFPPNEKHGITVVVAVFCAFMCSSVAHSAVLPLRSQQPCPPPPPPSPGRHFLHQQFPTLLLPTQTIQMPTQRLHPGKTSDENSQNSTTF